MLDTGAHGQNEGHRFYRKVIGYDGDGIDDDSVLLGSFTRSAGVLYPVDSNTFTGISMPTTGAGLKIFLDVDNDRNFLFLMNLFKPLASPSALEATLASYNKIDLTWTNGVTGTLVDTRILAPDYLTDLPTPTDSFRVTASQLNTQYCFRILHRVENAGGGTIDILSDTTSTECVTTPPQLWVNIRGPIIVRPEQECTWYTSHGGGITPYSWTWLIDDDTVGTGESWTGNAGGGHGSSFELEVHLASSDGQDARGTHTVSVVDTAPPFCPK